MRGQGGGPQKLPWGPGPTLSQTLSLLASLAYERQLQPLAYAMLRLQASFRDKD